MKRYWLIRKAGLPGNAATLKAAVQEFYTRRGKLPEAVVVTPGQVEATAAALVGLQLGRLPVRGLGGALAGEVWLESCIDGTEEMMPLRETQSETSDQAWAQVFGAVSAG